MYVIKRDGNREPVRFDKITNRLQKLINFEDVDPILITQKLSSRITTRENCNNFEMRKIKLFLFHDEDRFKRKIRLHLLS